MTTDDERVLVGVLDRAFDADSLFATLLNDTQRRARAATTLHQSAIRYANRYGVADSAEANRGLALWLPPGGEHLTFPRMLRTGFGGLALELGGALPGLLRIDSALTAMHKVHAPEKHWYLFFLAVDPAFHGQGIGGELLKQGIARAEAQGVPIYLETQAEENVRFYTRRGFVVKEEREILPGFTNWSLKHG
ncbi:GNAT family N-acetyltransferase [Armatimonas rosea]|uniref:Ribosomal protein S18 acetylase RimI-like enzyme n=1 Tax=Armatimonas rosea TaxID=685828 RepID=A0A7W9SSV6_ARMRO|nr:GNAT family N-acetyltransferase [Armatimonas rosea]MBB6052235.1 ribosomal protein S18 acetylase RimI-like enzyme [Armatimonas rosea]